MVRMVRMVRMDRGVVTLTTSHDEMGRGRGSEAHAILTTDGRMCLSSDRMQVCVRGPRP